MKSRPSRGPPRSTLLDPQIGPPGPPIGGHPRLGVLDPLLDHPGPPDWGVWTPDWRIPPDWGSWTPRLGVHYCNRTMWNSSHKKARVHICTIGGLIIDDLIIN